MINFNETILTNCIIHKVGNKALDGSLDLSKSEIALSEDLQFFLINFFLKPFKGITDVYRFHHSIDIKMNSIFTLCDNLFEDESLVKNSKLIAQHLFEQTRYSSIKAGDLFITQFSDIILGNDICKGIGIFKSEHLDSFLKINESNKEISASIDFGISQKKLDKGCLILNSDYHNGFKVLTYEYNNTDTAYWRNDFLGIQPLQDENYQTKNFLKICKDFVTERFPEQFEVTKTDQIDLLNRSMEYFKENKHFKMKDFTEKVFEHEEVVKEFRKYKSEVQREEEVDIDNSFTISSHAVKKQTKTFKSVLKLDKNFHVYIHGNRELIQQGVEKDGRKYYKIYFEEER